MPDRCQKCGHDEFKQVSYYTAAKGPALETEQLKARGEEEKFLNSLSGGSFNFQKENSANSEHAAMGFQH